MSTLLSQQLPAEPASLPRIRHAATAALAETGITDRELLGAIELALSEAVTNSINHAYPSTVGSVDVSMVQDDHEIILTVADTGVGIDHPADSPGLGLGLELIGHLATTSTITSEARGTTITMHFVSPPSNPSA